MNTNTLWQAAMVFGSVTVLLLFLALCVFVLGASAMLLVNAAMQLEEKLGI